MRRSLVDDMFPVDCAGYASTRVGRSKRGRAWAHEAAKSQETDPARLEREIFIFKSGRESKRQTLYARGAGRVDLKPIVGGAEERRGVTVPRLRRRAPVEQEGGRVIGNPLGKQRPRGFEGRFSRLYARPHTYGEG